jgi:hypothetical protein
MLIIGINGYKRSGKGAVGNAIQETAAAHKPFLVTKQVGFADKLKVIGARALGFVDQSEAECIELMNECKESWDFSIMKELPAAEGFPFPPQFPKRSEWHTLTGREYLQHLGNQAREVFGLEFWIDQVLPPLGLTKMGTQYALEAMYPYADILAITDLRYENEAERVLGLGGQVWRVNRPGTGSDGHASEQPLPDDLVTLEIENDGTLDDLHWKVNKLLEDGKVIETW